MFQTTNQFIIGLTTFNGSHDPFTDALLTSLPTKHGDVKLPTKG
jgi:hypothetical protein